MMNRILYNLFFLSFVGQSIAQSAEKFSISMISAQSQDFYFFEQACAYCDTLNEGGFSDWILPSVEEWSYLCSGGAKNAYIKSGIWLMMRNSYFQESNWRRVWGNTYGDIYRQTINGSCNTPIGNYNSCPQYVRCVR